MAVFTSVDASGLRALLSGYELGELVCFDGIKAGIENTNYFVDTSEGRFVLTLFEKLSVVELPFYLGLMRHLSERGVACPHPHVHPSWRALFVLPGKARCARDPARGV